MGQIFFNKNGRLAISYRNGQKVQFELLGDARGVIALDEESNAVEIAELREYVKRRVGGVSEISSEEFESAKKNHPYLPGDSFLRKSQVRLFSADAAMPKSISSQGNARRVLGAASAKLVEEGVSVQDVEAGAPSRRIPQPISKGRKVRIAKVSEEGTVTEKPVAAPEPPPPTSAEQP